MILTYRYRLLPTRQQHATLGRILEDQRQLYNAALAERIDAYQRSLLRVERGLLSKPTSIGFMDQTNEITILNNDPLTRDQFGAIPAFVHHWTLKRLDDAYKAFFRRVKAGNGKAGFPRFRGREYWRSFGATVQGGNSPVSFDGRRVRIGGRDPATNKRRELLRVRAHVHRPLPDGATTKAAVFTRDAGGRKWTVSLQCEIAPGALPARCQSATAAIGLDLGVAVAIAQSDGALIPGPRPGRRMRGAERRAARALARARRGSKGRTKARRRLAAIKAKAAEARKNWQHRQAARLTRSYAVIAAEDLAIANMTRSAGGTIEAPGRNVRAKAGLNREILDGAFAALREKITYKAARDGARLILVDPRYTSQACSECGAIDAASRVSQALYVCTACGHRDNADCNAAKNILARALGAAPQSSAGQPAGAGRPARGALGREAGNGAAGRHAPGNTAGASLPDGGGAMPSRRQLGHPARTIASAPMAPEPPPALAQRYQGDSGIDGQKPRSRAIRSPQRSKNGLHVADKER